jgi:hypothetical protein
MRIPPHHLRTLPIAQLPQREQGLMRISLPASTALAMQSTAGRLPSSSIVRDGRPVARGKGLRASAYVPQNVR